jgi:hypothetical protein
MVIEERPLVSLLRLVDRLPLPLLPGGHGRPYFYGEPLILKARVVMLVRRLLTVQSLLRGWPNPRPSDGRMDTESQMPVAICRLAEREAHARCSSGWCCPRPSAGTLCSPWAPRWKRYQRCILHDGS